MSKPCRRPKRAEIKAQRREKRAQGQALRAQLQQAGHAPTPAPALPNRCSAYAGIAEEQQAREAAVSGQLGILRKYLPQLLARLGRIPDVRTPRKCRHKLTVLLLYGLLMFVFQFASRRAVNRELTRPQFEANLRLLFPELETLPHADTLYRLLAKIDVSTIEAAHVALVQRLLRGKSFRRYLINNCYPIAIDGSQKLARAVCFDAPLLARTHGTGEQAHTQYYLYVLEASLAFRGGLVIPLLSEFLDHAQGDTDNDKQDCELRACARLAERLKTSFPRLPILLLLDGLYANGPLMRRCAAYHWQFMIVLRDNSLPSVWEEFHALSALTPEHTDQQHWGGRAQRFTWVNDIDYAFRHDGVTHRLRLHVVLCEETWQALDERGALLDKHARHAWLSSRPLSAANVHQRCNLAARHRWGIEAGFLVEKHQGYHYEHAFALDVNALRGYHYLMRMAHLFNTLARFAAHMQGVYRSLGVRPTLDFIRQSCAAPWLDPERMRALLAKPLRLHLQIE
jgi:hypothetical protein